MELIKLYLRYLSERDQFLLDTGDALNFSDFLLFLILEELRFKS